MKTCAAMFLLVWANAVALPALAQETTDDWPDRVVVSAVDPFVAYPAASVSPRGASTVYEIDMTTALQPAPASSVTMTWTPQGTAYEVCFEHGGERRCRVLDAKWSYQVPPRFMPTKSEHWPTVYVSFADKDGHTSMIVYAGGTIMTREEETAQLRVSQGSHH